MTCSLALHRIASGGVSRSQELVRVMGVWAIEGAHLTLDYEAWFSYRHCSESTTSSLEITAKPRIMTPLKRSRFIAVCYSGSSYQADTVTAQDLFHEHKAVGLPHSLPTFEEHLDYRMGFSAPEGRWKKSLDTKLSDPRQTPPKTHTNLWRNPSIFYYSVF